MTELMRDRTGSPDKPDQAFGIANEFTGVWVSKVKTAQGERLELRLPRTGACIQLDAMQLEAIVALKSERFSEFIALVMDNPKPQ
jgi:hypothetical protein